MKPEELRALEDIARTHQKIMRAKHKLLELEQQLAMALSALVGAVKNGKDVKEQPQDGGLLRDARKALDHCFERLGYSADNIEGLLPDQLFWWWREDPTVRRAQEQKYEAAMAEKQGKAKARKRLPANVVPLRTQREQKLPVEIPTN